MRISKVLFFGINTAILLIFSIVLANAQQAEPTWVDIELKGVSRDIAVRFVKDWGSKWKCVSSPKGLASAPFMPVDYITARLVIKEAYGGFKLAYWMGSCPGLRVSEGWIKPREAKINLTEKGPTLIFINDEDYYGYGTLSFILQPDGSLAGKNHRQLLREINLR